MKPVFTALAPSPFATPRLAQSGPHMHLHSGEVGGVGLGAELLAASGAFILKASK